MEQNALLKNSYLYSFDATCIFVTSEMSMNPESLRAEGSLERGLSPATSPGRETQQVYTL